MSFCHFDVQFEVHFEVQMDNMDNKIEIGVI